MGIRWPRAVNTARRPSNMSGRMGWPEASSAGAPSDVRLAGGAAGAGVLLREAVRTESEVSISRITFCQNSSRAAATPLKLDESGGAVSGMLASLLGLDMV